MLPAFGPTPHARLDRLRRGGYTIVTSLDPAIQASAMRHVTDNERIGDRYALGAVFLQPGTGQVKAVAVNRRYSLDQSRNPANTDPAKRAAHLPANYPNTVNMLLGGGTSIGYQAGSTFKLFTMLAALERGYGLNLTFYAPHQLVSSYPSGWHEPQSCGGRWCPHPPRSKRRS